MDMSFTHENDRTAMTKGIRRQAIATGVIGLAIAVGAYFLGQHVGYRNGFNVAYSSEHSHYLFEKTRGDNMQRRIAVQRRCIERTINAMTPVTDSGFSGLGEIMVNVKIYVFGSMACDRAAGFGAVTPQQWEAVMSQH
jgi:hypothetical protein